MSTVSVSPLRQRMVEDMNARKLCAETQRGHIHSCKRFAAFLKQSPDTATAEDIRRFQLSADASRWISSRPDFLAHVNVLARLFRGKFLAMLIDAHSGGQLKFFNTHAGLADKRTFKKFLAPLRRVKWVVYCKEPFAGPKQVLRYLSRYTHRVAISNRRLVAADDGGVSFRWKDYRIEGPGRWKTMT